MIDISRKFRQKDFTTTLRKKVLQSFCSDLLFSEDEETSRVTSAILSELETSLHQFFGGDAEGSMPSLDSVVLDPFVEDILHYLQDLSRTFDRESRVLER